MRSIETTADLADLADLPASFDVVTAGRYFGLGRTVSYRLARSGDFPAPVLRLGGRLIVTKAALCAALGVPLAGR
jgi:hypothetical protein